MSIAMLIPRVTNLQQFAPDLDIRISNLVGSFNLEREGVDIAIIHGTTDEWQDYYCEKLGDDELVMVCSSNIYDALHCAELLSVALNQPIIMVNNERRKHDWDIWCQAHALALPTLHNNLTFNTSVQAIHAAIRGLGVLVTHKLFVKDEIEQGLLSQVGKPILNPFHAFYFACLPDKLKYPSITTLQTWLKAEFEHPKKQ